MLVEADLPDPEPGPGEVVIEQPQPGSTPRTTLLASGAVFGTLVLVP